MGKIMDSIMKRKILTFFLFLIVLIIILPVLYYSMLSIPYADDFSNAADTRIYMEKYGNSFFSGLAYARDLYMGFQGTYTGIFLLVFCAPFYKGGLLGLRLFNSACILFFFASLYFVVYMFICNMKTSGKRTQLTLLLYVPILFFITNNYMNSEIYTWYTVISIYVIPMTFVLIGTGLYLLYMKTRKYGLLGACVCGVIAAGGAINVATLLCGLYFLISFYYIYQLRLSVLRRHYAPYVPLFCAVLATLVNVIAPGNYVRYNMGETKVSLIEAFFTGYKHVILRMGEILISTPFLLVIVIIFVFVFDLVEFDYSGKMSYSHPLLIGLIFLTGVAIVNLPYTYGNRLALSSDVFEDRAYFVQDMTIYLLFFVWGIYFIGFIKRNYKLLRYNDSHYVLLLVVSVGFVFIYTWFGGTQSLTTPYMISSIADGSAHNYSDYQEEIMSMIEFGDDDVCIYYDKNRAPITDRFIKGLGLSDETNDYGLFWHNDATARFYGKRHVYVVY